MKIGTFIYVIVFFTILFFSCDGETGINGIVQDSETGFCLSGVKVDMISHYENISVITDSTGYFYTRHYYTCGLIIKKCDDKFSIKFEKDGYDKLEFDENYKSEKDYVSVIDAENVIIKLKRLK